MRVPAFPFSAAVIGLSLTLWAESGPTKPNLLFVYLDDFGWRDAGFMGSDFYETPHLDRLAARGMIFTDAYSAAANCAPARASLMSGQYSPRHRIFNVGTEARGPSKQRRLLHIPGTDVLDPDIVTWAECLQEAGYLTAAFGKWHLGDDPCEQGFEINVAGSHSGSPPRGYYPPHPGVPGLGEVGPDEYLTDTLNDRAVGFVLENSDRPWALYLSHFAVHTPLDPKKDLVEKYKSKPPGELHQHVALATMIESVDEGIGRVVEAIEQSGAGDRTIVIFSSDNGGYGPATDMAPLRGYKGTYYEGGIRVPLFVVWPGEVAEGSRSAVPVSGVDLYPTICEMLDAPIPDSHVADGKSLVSLLRGEPHELAERTLFWHFPAYLQSYGKNHADEQRDPHFRSRPCSLVRKGRWKLIQYFEDDDYELFDLFSDVGECMDVLLEQPDVAKQMKDILGEFLDSTDAPIPQKANPEFKDGR